MSLTLIYQLLAYLTIWSWRDLLEVVIFATILYYISRWLATHTTKRLVIIFYGYCLAIIFAYSLDLPATMQFLIGTAPVFGMLLMLMHQSSLQKQFVMPKRIIPAQRDHQWIEVLMQSCMNIFADNHDICIVIECCDDIGSLMQSPCPINAIIHKELISMLQKSPLFDHSKLLWLRADGAVVGVNCSWHHSIDKLITTCDNIHEDLWKQHAIMLTAKTDAFIFKGSKTTNTFTIITQGFITEKITAHHCMQLITKHIQELSTTQGKEIKRENKNSSLSEHPHAPS